MSPNHSVFKALLAGHMKNKIKIEISWIKDRAENIARTGHGTGVNLPMGLTLL